MVPLVGKTCRLYSWVECTQQFYIMWIFPRVMWLDINNLWIKNQLHSASIGKGNDCVYRLFTVSDCVRLQLPVPIRMEGSTLFWDRVCVWCRAQSPSSVRPRLHLHPSPEWLYLPVPPGDCGAPLRERSHHWTPLLYHYLYIFIYLFHKTRACTIQLFNCSIVLPVQLWPSLIHSSAATSLRGCHSHLWVSDTGLFCSCSSSLYHPMASLCTPHNISVPELVRTLNSLLRAGFFLINWNIMFTVLTCNNQDHYFLFTSCHHGTH